MPFIHTRASKNFAINVSCFILFEFFSSFMCMCVSVCCVLVVLFFWSFSQQIGNDAENAKVPSDEITESSDTFWSRDGNGRDKRTASYTTEIMHE